MSLAQTRELQGYQAMKMAELASSVGAQVAERQQEVNEDKQLLSVRAGVAITAAGTTCLAVATAHRVLCAVLSLRTSASPRTLPALLMRFATWFAPGTCPHKIGAR